MKYIKKRLFLLCLAPSAAGFFIFYIIPFFYSFYYAFTGNAFTKKFVWFDNFIIIIQNESFQNAMKNTIKFTLVSVPLIMVISFVTAQLTVLFAAKIPFVKRAFFLPFVLPSAVIVVFWQTYFNGAAPFTSLLACFLWKYSGINIMLFMAAISRLPCELFESAELDGAGRLRQSVSIVLPLISPTLFFVGILSTVNSFKIFKESYLLYGQYPDQGVYMLQNYLNNHFIKLNYQNISTAAIIFFTVTYIFVAVAFYLEKRAAERIW